MNETVLITGASGGIGKALAELFAQNGAHLILVARSQDKLEHLQKELTKKYDTEVTLYAVDLSSPKAAKELWSELHKQNKTVDILINNAGFGNRGLFAETSLQEEFDMIQLNITSLTLLSKLFLKEMMSRNSGKILNVASTAAFQPGPLMAVYFATKAYVLSLSQALSNEVQGTNVHVSVLCPGPTATGFQERAFTQGTNPSWRYMDVQTVAQAAYTGLKKNKTLIIPGTTNKIFAFLVRFLPRNFTMRVIRNMTKQ